MAAQYIPIKRISSLDAPIKAEKLDGSLFTTENQAHEFIISVRKNGVKQTVTGSVSGKFIRANGTTIFLQGSIVDGDAVVRLHQDCYNVQGRFTFNIFNTQSGVTTCIYSAVGKMDMGSTETVIDAGDVVPDISDVVAKQEEMTQVITDARAATSAASQAATEGENKFVRFDTSQTLTEAQKSTARTNIDSPSNAEITDLKSALGKVVAQEYTLSQNAHKYDAGSWILSPNLESGKKYRITLVPNTTFTCTVITIGTTPYAAGVVDTLGTNVSCISGTPISYDVDINASGIGYVRMPSQSANFSSVSIYEQSVHSRAVLYDSDMTLTEEQQGVARDNIGAASTNDIDDAINPISTQIIGEKAKKTANESIIFLTEPGIYGVDVPYDSQVITVYGRNRFDNAGASYSFSGYSAQQTLEKTDSGISVQCRVTQTSAYLYAYAEYVAEFTGRLFFSCEADCSGNIADVCVLPSVNGVAQTRLYGKGKLFEELNVTAGDTIRLAFYTHMGTDASNTVTYKKIMLAYGGLYAYEEYGTEKTYRLPTDASIYNVGATSGDTQNWIKLPLSVHQLPSSIFPDNNNSVANCAVNGLPLVPYNDTYNMENGLGIASGGTIGLYIDGLNRQGVMDYIAAHDVTITYRSGGSVTVTSDREYKQGEIIVLTSPAPVTYYYDKEELANKIVCFGDSITGMFGNECGYPAMLELLHGYDAVNVGFSGCRWTDHSNANYRPFCMNRLAEAISSGDYTVQDASPLVDTSSASYNPLYAEHLANLKSLDWDSVDYATMFWGTNDWGDGAILRSADDPSTNNKQRTNVEDAIKYSISQIVSKYPWVKVIVITPYWRAITSGKDSNIDPNSNGEYLYDWSEFIGEVAQDNFNIPVVALYRTLGANVLTNRYFTQDGTHPTEITKHIIADRITAMMETY